MDLPGPYDTGSAAGTRPIVRIDHLADAYLGDHFVGGYSRKASCVHGRNQAAGRIPSTPFDAAENARPPARSVAALIRDAVKRPVPESETYQRIHAVTPFREDGAVNRDSLAEPALVHIEHHDDVNVQRR